jgi:hypothetical protein
MPSRRRQPSVHYMRKNVPEAARPVGVAVKRRVSTDVGFLGSPAVREILGPQSTLSKHRSGELTLIDRDHGNRLAATYPGTRNTMHHVLTGALTELPDILVDSVDHVEVIPQAADFTVAVVPSRALRQVIIEERLLIYAIAGASWMNKSHATRLPHVEVHRTASESQAEQIASSLTNALGDAATALVLGEPFLIEEPA